MLTKLTRTALPALLALSMPMAALAQDTATETPAVTAEAPAPDTVVAKVGNVEITMAHVAAMASRLPAEYAQLPADQLFDGILEQLIQQASLAQSAGELSRASALVLENEERALKAAQVVAAELDKEIPEEDIEAAFKEQFGDFEGATEYKAAHILLETEEDAQAVIDELEKGADFATLAKEKSTGPSGPSGGDLGWFTADMMVDPFSEAVLEMEPGSVSAAPVETQFGWHVIKLEESRKQDAPTYESVREQLAAELTQTHVQNVIDEAVAKANVTRQVDGINKETLRDPALLED